VDNILKQRLVGAIVLISLAVIFLPMLFSGNGQFQSRFQSGIPPQPSYDIVASQLKVPEQVPSKVLEKVPLIQPTESKASNETPATQASAQIEQSHTDPDPSVPENPTPAINTPSSQKATPPVTGWVVQVGSFYKKKNAMTLRDRLRKKGLSSFVVTGRGKNGPIYRVRVGPELDRKKADNLLRTVESETRLKALLLTYP